MASIQNKTRIRRNSEIQKRRSSVLIDWGEGKWWFQWPAAYLRTGLMLLLIFSENASALSLSNRKDDLISAILNRRPDFMTRKQDSPRSLWWAGPSHQNASLSKFDRAG